MSAALRPALRGPRQSGWKPASCTLMQPNPGINPPCETEIRSQRTTTAPNRQTMPSQTPGFLHTLEGGNLDLHCYVLYPLMKIPAFVRMPENEPMDPFAIAPV